MDQLDILVLGAGIVGASTAHHLLQKGNRVALIDRREPGRETSFGNAGIVDSNGLEPILFPRDPAALLRYASNLTPAAHYHFRYLPKMTPWLFALHRASAPAQTERYFEAIAPLMSRALGAHHALALETGALPMYRDTGWLRMYRTPSGFRGTKAMLERADRIGMEYQILSSDELQSLEPNVADVSYRTIFWPKTQTVASPGVVTESIVEHFAAQGGLFRTGDAQSLQQVENNWQVQTERGGLSAPQVVVCLGPWSTTLLKRFGYQLPLEMVRGYHTHLSVAQGARLGRPLVDVENGYLLTQMSNRVRLTTAFEFAAQSAESTPVQIDRVLPAARKLFPLGEEIGERWLGSRPCFPDTLPLVDRAANHPGMWFHFGHSYLGFTLGPLLGQLLAQWIAGEDTEIDLTPYSAARFSR